MKLAEYQILLPDVVFLPEEPGPSGHVILGNPDAFIAGPENWLALAAVQRMIEPNPPPTLTLFGPPGSGKSHLVGLLTRCWQNLFPEQKILFWTSAEFGQQVAEALAAGRWRAFRQHWARAQWVIVEDLQFLSEYPGGQRELVLMLQAAERGRLHLVFTSRLNPILYEELDPRIGQILQAGLTAPVKLPGLAARKLILRVACSRQGVLITEPALDLLCQEKTGSARQLTSLAMKLHEVIGRGPIDYSMALQFLRGEDHPAAVSIPEVSKAVARHFRIPLKRLRGGERTSELVYARNIAIYLCHNLTGATLREIGDYFGKRDHTTVGHSCRKIVEQLEEDNCLKRDLVQIQERLGLTEFLVGV